MSKWCRHCGKENSHFPYCVMVEVDDLREAVRAFMHHFGSLHDNPMLHEKARECFRLGAVALAHSKPRPFLDDNTWVDEDGASAPYPADFIGPVGRHSRAKPVPREPDIGDLYKKFEK